MHILFNIAFIESIPAWTPIVIFIVLLFLFGDKILWDYEVNFAYQEGYGSGEVEIECKERKGVELELEFDLEDSALYQEVTVLLKNELIYNISAEENHRKRLKIQEKIQLPEPQAGDLVEVAFGGKTIFSGKLVKD